MLGLWNVITKELKVRDGRMKVPHLNLMAKFWAREYSLAFQKLDNPLHEAQRLQSANDHQPVSPVELSRELFFLEHGNHVLATQGCPWEFAFGFGINAQELPGGLPTDDRFLAVAQELNWSV